MSKRRGLLLDELRKDLLALQADGVLPPSLFLCCGDLLLEGEGLATGGYRDSGRVADRYWRCFELGVLRYEPLQGVLEEDGVDVALLVDLSFVLFPERHHAVYLGRVDAEFLGSVLGGLRELLGSAGHAERLVLLLEAFVLLLDPLLVGEGVLMGSFPLLDGFFELVYVLEAEFLGEGQLAL